MSSQVEKLEKNQVKLSIEISAEDFRQAMSQAYKKKARQFRIPGFRPGKAPMNMALRYYGEGALYEDCIDLLLAKAYPEAIREHKLEPVDRPELDIEEIGSEKGLKAQLLVTVKPEAELGQYKGLEAEQHQLEVTDEMVENSLKRVLERNARMVPVEDRGIEEGDTADIDYEGKVDGEVFEGGSAQGHKLRIGSKSFIPGFEDQLVGHKAGEDVLVDLSFPEDYHAENLKGKPAQFSVHINRVERRELPEADDEFAKDVSEFDTLEEYKADLRRQREEEIQQAMRSELENNALTAAIKNLTVDVPEAMVEREVDEILYQQEQQMAQMGMNLETYLSYLGKKIDEYREEQKPQALQRVKLGLLLEAVVKAEDIQVSEEEFEAELAKLAAEHKQELDQVKERMTEEVKESFIDNMKRKKAADLIVDTAIPVEPKPRETVEVKAGEQKETQEDA